MKKWLVWPAAVLGAIGVLGLGNRWRSGETATGARVVQAASLGTQPPATPSGLEVNRLNGQLAALRAEVLQLRADLAEKPSSVDPPSGAKTPVADPPPPRDPDLQREEWHAHMLEVGSKFQEEVVVAAWANQATSKTKDTFANSDALKNLSPTIECRARTCKVVIADDGSQAVRDAVDILPRQNPELSKAQVDWTRDSKDAPIATIYLGSSRGQ